MAYAYMRHPSQYRHDTSILVGYVFNHNDSIKKDVLHKFYEETAERWKAAYHSDYGQDVDKDHVRSNYHSGSCAAVIGIVPEAGHCDGGGDGGGCGGCGGCGGD